MVKARPRPGRRVMRARRFPRLACVLAIGGLLALPPATPGAEEDKVVTVVSARTGNGYKRERLKDGTFKPESYALSNGGRIAGTTSDFTVDKVAYHDVAEMAIRLLAQQSYHYQPRDADQAKLLLVLFWGNTIAEHRTGHEQTQAATALALEAMRRLNQGEDVEGTAPPPITSKTPYATPEEAAAADTEIKRMLRDDKMRERLNEHNARLLGYSSDLKEARGVQRWAGGGDHYNDLIADLGESRYYIVILAYDGPELMKKGRKKLLWTTRVSVSSADNRFDDCMAAMLRGAAKHFGQDRGKLVRSEESKGRVAFGDPKFLGVAKEPAAARPGEPGAKK